MKYKFASIAIDSGHARCVEVKREQTGMFGSATSVHVEFMQVSSSRASIEFKQSERAIVVVEVNAAMQESV